MVRTTINACHDLKKSSFFRKTVALDEVTEKEAPQVKNSEILDEIGKLPGNYRTAIYRQLPICRADVVVSFIRYIVK